MPMVPAVTFKDATHSQFLSKSWTMSGDKSTTCRQGGALDNGEPALPIRPQLSLSPITLRQCKAFHRGRETLQNVTVPMSPTAVSQQKGR